MTSNLILSVDSYKASHFKAFVPGARRMHYYIEARRREGLGIGLGRELMVAFGLQAFIRQYLLKPFGLAQIEEARAFFADHGLPFHEEGWKYIRFRHGGYLPLTIRGVPEGTVLPAGNAIVTVENTDPSCFWLPGYIETALLRAIWYPTTVATLSWQAKQIIRRFLEKTSDDSAAELPFKLHDFGARGASSAESAALGGMAHLVNFMGSDTVEGVMAARRFYDEPMAGFSIPAAEHSTITSWGSDREVEVYEHYLNAFGGPGKLVAVVSDSYDLWNAIGIWGGELRQKVLDTGGTLVVRPDSGNPVTVVKQAIEHLADRFGAQTNSKGYKVLHPSVRVIQGDGINLTSILDILTALELEGWSASNVAFGMGGGLLQQVNRDTLGFAMKASALVTDEDKGWRGFGKAPSTDPGKASRIGRQVLLQDSEGRWATLPREEDQNGGGDLFNEMRPVYVNGHLLAPTTFAEVRARTNRPLP